MWTKEVTRANVYKQTNHRAFKLRSAFTTTFPLGRCVQTQLGYTSRTYVFLIERLKLALVTYLADNNEVQEIRLYDGIRCWRWKRYR